MTSWTDYKSIGSGETIFLLEILGVGVFSTYDYTPSDSWFTSAGYGSSRVYPWLQHVDLGPLSEDINFIESNLEVGEITARITDVDGLMTALRKDYRAGNFTWLTSSVSETATTFPVVDTAGFSSTTNEIAIGQEVARYTGTTSGSFTGLTRGVRGTTARAYTVMLDESLGILEQPVVTEEVHTIIGRKAYLHACFLENGTPGSTSVIYRGRISKALKLSGGTYSITLEHISTVLKEKVGQRLPSSPLKQGYFMCGEDNYSGCHCTVDASTDYSDYITVPEGYYTAAELAEAWNSAAYAFSPDHNIYLEWNDEKYQLRSTAVSGERFYLIITEGDPLWCLGFDPSTILSPLSSGLAATEADDEPRLFCLQWGEHSRTVSPQFEVDDTSVFFEGQYIQVPGSHWGKIATASGTTITLEPRGFDGLLDSPPATWTIKDEEDDMVCRHVIVFGLTVSGYPMHIKESIKKALFLESGQSEPEQWLASGMSSDDIDFDELDEALSSVPTQLQKFYDVVIKGTEVWKLFAPALGSLAIAPRITSEGRIGFIRLQTPTLAQAVSVEVDEDIWSNLSPDEIEGAIGDTSLLNLIYIKHSKDYSIEEDNKQYGPPVKITWSDGWNQLRKTRSLEYECGCWHIGTRLSSGATGTLESFAQEMNQQIRATHFGLYGRESFTIDLPCTWTAKQIKCGDVVKVTSEIIPDMTSGVLGMTNRLGVVLGKTEQTTGAASERLTILFGADVNGTGIAPCAHADSWDSGSYVLTFSACDTPLFEAAGNNDLDRFSIGDNVRLIQRDSASPLTFTATIDNISIAGKTVKLTSLPFGSLPAGGVYMVFADYDDASTDQQDWAYLADNAASPSLGTAGDEPQEWTI